MCVGGCTGTGEEASQCQEESTAGGRLCWCQQWWSVAGYGHCWRLWAQHLSTCTCTCSGALPTTSTTQDCMATQRQRNTHAHHHLLSLPNTTAARCTPPRALLLLHAPRLHVSSSPLLQSAPSRQCCCCCHPPQWTPVPTLPLLLARHVHGRCFTRCRHRRHLLFFLRLLSLRRQRQRRPSCSPVRSRPRLCSFAEPGCSGGAAREAHARKPGAPSLTEEVQSWLMRVEQRWHAGGDDDSSLAIPCDGLSPVARSIVEAIT